MITRQLFRTPRIYTDEEDDDEELVESIDLNAQERDAVQERTAQHRALVQHLRYQPTLRTPASTFLDALPGAASGQVGVVVMLYWISS